MKKHLIFIIVFISLIFQSVYAQTTYIKVFGDSLENDIAYNIIETSDDNYIVTGTSCDDYYLLKIKPDGEMIWEKNYGNANKDVAYDVIETDNGYLMTGYNQINNGMWLLKTNIQGDSLWAKSYPGFGAGKAICSTPDSNFIITGKYLNDVYAMKIDRYGDSLWTRIFNNDSIDDEGIDIAKAGDSGYVILCSPGIKQIKIDELGKTIWEKNHQYSTVNISAFQGYSNMYCNDGGFLITGSCTYSDPSIGMLVYGLIIKTNDFGDTLWTKTISSVYMELRNAIELDNEEYIITGNGVENYSSNESIPIIKVNKFGEILWKKHICDIEDYYFRSNGILKTIDHGYIITGVKDQIDYNNKKDIFVAKSDSTGEIQSSINELNVMDFILHPNYPNPFNPNTIINYELSKNGALKITIYDILGREIQELYNDYQRTGKHTVLWDGSDYSSGIYFCKIVFNGMLQNIKMLLIK